MEQLMSPIQSIWLASCKESSKLVVLTNNYSPDYAPFTVDKKGTLEKVPVQIRVGFEILRVFFSKISFSDWLDQDSGYQWSWSNIRQPIQPLHDLVMKFSYLKSTYDGYHFTKMIWWPSFHILNEHMKCNNLSKWSGEQENPRFDFRLKLHNMKENINMNTLTKAEKEVMVVYVT